ncbi:MAG: hypothetical protein FWH21_00915 [Kiritimatiellaeota bacterium]|nr:hypothetical protein [Kiritimatiellota bacterium]
MRGTKHSAPKRAYSDRETITNLMAKTGCEYREAEQELAIGRYKAFKRGLGGGERDAYAYRVAKNALLDQADSRVRLQRREVSIHNQVPGAPYGLTYADTLECRDNRKERRERLEQLGELLRSSGTRTLELARMCLSVADLADPEATDDEIQRRLRELWHTLYPHANSRDYYSQCGKIVRCLKAL